jgi:hypothetical protein
LAVFSFPIPFPIPLPGGLVEISVKPEPPYYQQILVALAVSDIRDRGIGNGIGIG